MHIGEMYVINVDFHLSRLDLLGRLDFAERMARQQQIDDTDALESTLDWVWSKDHEKLSSFTQ